MYDVTSERMTDCMGKYPIGISIRYMMFVKYNVALVIMQETWVLMLCVNFFVVRRDIYKHETRSLFERSLPRLLPPPSNDEQPDHRDKEKAIAYIRGLIIGGRKAIGSD